MISAYFSKVEDFLKSAVHQKTRRLSLSLVLTRNGAVAIASLQHDWMLNYRRKLPDLLKAGVGWCVDLVMWTRFEDATRSKGHRC